MNDTHSVGTEMRPLRVAVVGSGPSGFYAAESLLKRKDLTVSVDMFDRLPTPFGLVRGGVAPDHQKIKAVIALYTRAATHPRFRFFGNVKLGLDIQVTDLTAHYDQIVYAVGNESDRQMGIPGEDLEGSCPATNFVGWYNGHPDHRDHKFDLTIERVAVVGVGNVAMDVTRILTKDPDEVAGTDIAGYALKTLRASNVKEVIVLGRRGIAQAAFSPKEIKEIAELPGVDLVLDPADVVVDELSEDTLADANKRKNVDFLTAQAALGEGLQARKVRLRFLVSPVEIVGVDGRVTAVKIEKNELYRDDNGTPRPRGSGKYETLPVGMVLRSVGYCGVPIPGVPFHERWGIIPNEEGRVTEGGRVVAGQYAVGWAKRGPSGLIGTNRGDSVATVDKMIEDLAESNAAAAVGNESEKFPALLAERGVRYVDFDGWRELDRIERERGKAAGKIREKFTRVEEMLAAIG
jgi:ferredoxin--NADP+ reductase